MNSCYNKNHTRYKEIERYYNLPPLVIDAILLDYHNKTGLDENSFPTVELLRKLNAGVKTITMSKEAANEERRKYKEHPALAVTLKSNKDKVEVTYTPKIQLVDIEELKQSLSNEITGTTNSTDIYFSLQNNSDKAHQSLVKEMQRSLRYYVDNYGNIYTDRLRDSDKETINNLIVRYNANYGTRFYLKPTNKGDKFRVVNPNSSYNQLDTESAEKPSKKVNDALQLFIDKLGINVETLDSLKERLGVDANGAADILNKIIYIASGKARIDTLPEEVAHFFVELLPYDSPLLKSMMDRIENYDIYYKVVEQYNEQYEGDTDKLKKEAIGKLIANEIINGVEREEIDELQRRVFKNWWSKLWDYIKTKFSDFVTNTEFMEVTNPEMLSPYKQAALSILKGDVRGLKKSGKGVYLQQGQTEQSAKSNAYDALRSIIKKEQVRDSKGNLSEDYTINGVSRESLGLSRATTVAKSKYKQADREGNIEIDDVYAKQGTMIHELVQHIILNAEKEFTNQTELPIPYAKGSKEYLAYIKARPMVKAWAMDILKKGGIIKIEQPIVNYKLGYIGTIDILVINKDGTEEIYDIKTRKNKEMSFAKREEYDKQVTVYKKMIQAGEPKHNLAPAKVTKTRIFGIQVRRDKDNKFKTIVFDALDSVVAGEVTGDPLIDEKLEVLRYKLSRLQFRFNSLYDSKEKIELGEKISTINFLIDEIVDSKDINMLADFAEDEISKTAYELNFNNIDYEKLQNMYYNMLMYEDLDVTIPKGENIDTNKFKEVAQESKILKDRIVKMIKSKLLSDIRKDKLFADKEESSILNIATPQSNWSANIRGASFTRDDYVKIANDEIVNAKERARIKFTSFADKLKKEVTEFLSKEPNFDKLINPKTGDLWAKFKLEFFNEKKKAKSNKNWDWFKDNFEVTEQTKEFYNQLVERQKEVYNSLPNSIIDRRYKLISSKYEGMDITKRQALLLDWKVNHPIIIYGKIKNEEKYYTEQYKAIKNTPHLDRFFSFWEDSIKEFSSITGKNLNNNLVPNVSKQTLERLMSNGIGDAVKSVFNFDWLLTNEQQEEDNFDNVYYDPLTKEKVYKVPLAYTNQNLNQLVEKYKKQGNSEEKSYELAKEEFTKNKSKELGQSLYLFASAVYNNAAMQEIEHKIAAIRILTNNLGVDNIDKSLNKKEKEQVIKNIHRTSEQVTDLMEVYVYGKKDNSDSPELKEKLDKLNKFTALSRLALNMFSPVTNLLGAGVNSYIQAAKKVGFTTSNLNKGYSRVLKGDKKAEAFTKLIPAYMEELTREDINEFSVNKNLAKTLNTDNAFFAWRIGDKLVQKGVLQSLLDSHTIVDGKIVNKIKYLKQKYNYSYTMDAETRQEVLKKIQEEAKQLKSVYDQGTLDKNDNIDLSSLGVSEQELIDFKRKALKTSKYIMGNLDPNDMAMIKRNMWGRMFMTFRSWIQAMGDERFMDKYYDSELEETIEGRYKVLFNIFKEKGLAHTVKLQLGLLNGYKENLTDEQIAAIRANARELQFILIAVLAVVLANSGDDDDKSAAAKYAIKITDRLIDELTFFINPVAVFDIIKSPVASSSIIEDVGRFLKEGLDFTYYGLFGDEQEFEEKVKLKRAFTRGLPIAGQAFKFSELFTDSEE